LAPSAHIGVVYLVRKAEGSGPPARFLASYRKYQAGEPHDLILVFKGFASNDPEAARIREIFSGLVQQEIAIADEGVDITAYIHAASCLPHRTLCFLNTFSVIRTANWLSLLMRHFEREDVGMVGASGSYESLRSSMYLLSKVVWLCAAMQIPYDRKVARYYRWLLRSQYPSWLERTRSERLRALWARQPDYRTFDPGYAAHWNAVIQPGAPISWAPDYPDFPNPHLRSNAFMIDRQMLLSFGFPKIVEKMESCAFESGHQSLTARVRALGKTVLVVGRDGVGYDIPDWPTSRTFRLGDQSNMLVTDNQVMNFGAYSAAERSTHVLMTWGEYTKLPLPVPSYGIEFQRPSTRAL
jgi:hypothetical protein